MKKCYYIKKACHWNIKNITYHCYIMVNIYNHNNYHVLLVSKEV